MKALPIVWQRLVDPAGQTCDRCQLTHEALEKALRKLKAALRPSGIEPVLETKVLDPETFARDPLQSNRVWIAGKPIEEWLSAGVGQSPCCSACGDFQCRTIEIGEAVFEEIPEELFLRAGLIATAQLLGHSVVSGRNER